MGSYEGSSKGHFKGIHRDFVGVYGLGLTWRFMGSYKWCYKSPDMG